MYWKYNFQIFGIIYFIYLYIIYLFIYFSYIIVFNQPHHYQLIICDCLLIILSVILVLFFFSIQVKHFYGWPRRILSNQLSLSSNVPSANGKNTIRPVTISSVWPFIQQQYICNSTINQSSSSLIVWEALVHLTEVHTNY